jgi:hypothetical protein
MDSDRELSALGPDSRGRWNDFESAGRGSLRHSDLTIAHHQRAFPDDGVRVRAYGVVDCAVSLSFSR